MGTTGSFSATATPGFSCPAPIFQEKEEYTLSVNIDPEGGGSSECAGYVIIDDAIKYYGPGEYVKLTAVGRPSCCVDEVVLLGTEFKSWQGDGVDIYGDAIEGSIKNPLRIAMNDNRSVTAVIGPAKCGNGTFGRNFHRAVITDLFASDQTKAIAWQETMWKQFNCDGSINKNENATGMMQIFPSQWPDSPNNGELGREIHYGSLCSADGYAGNQTYNKELGEAIWDHRWTLAKNALLKHVQENAITFERQFKEAAAKYYIRGSAYWNRDSLSKNPPVWEPNSGNHVNHANAVWARYENKPWNSALVCQCE